MLPAAAIEEMLQIGETRQVEVKGPGLPGDKYFIAKVARAVLGLSNTRDGGTVIIGVDDKAIAAMSPGLDPAQAAAWADADTVAAKLATFADPPVGLRSAVLTVSNGNTVAVLEVGEFTDVPTICARDYQNELVKGRIYVRPRGMVRSVEVPSSYEMRALMDLATEKSLRDFLSTATRAGLIVGRPQTTHDHDAEMFNKQREEGWQ